MEVRYQSRAPAALTQEKESAADFEKEAGWAPEPE